ncbi:MAG TPA: DUF4149 domain-containing protein [Kofleriaceae bacterium]|nr:DUF4149 domain-containing protein [Kofleriaceae bacterium]
MTVQLIAGVWAGALIGVSFLATPVKFRAQTLPYHAALEVGRLTFRALGWLELALAALAAVAAAVAPSALPTWTAGPAAAVAGALVVQRGWLLRRMDARVEAAIAARGRPPPSRLHHVYIASETIKLIALLAVASG